METVCARRVSRCPPDSESMASFVRSRTPHPYKQTTCSMNVNEYYHDCVVRQGENTIKFVLCDMKETGMKVLRSEASESKCDDNTKATGKETGSKKKSLLRIVKDWRKVCSALGNHLSFPLEVLHPRGTVKHIQLQILPSCYTISPARCRASNPNGVLTSANTDHNLLRGRARFTFSSRPTERRQSTRDHLFRQRVRKRILSADLFAFSRDRP